VLLQVLRITLLLCLLVSQSIPAAAGQPPAVAQGDASVIIFNRIVATFRAPLLGVPAQERARRAEDILMRMSKDAGVGSETVTLLKIPQGYSVLVNGVLAFSMVPEDVDPVMTESLEQTAQRSAKVLELVLQETREARNGAFLLRALGFVVLATVVLLVVVWLISRVRGWLTVRLTRLAHSHAERLKVGGESLVNRERMLQLVRRIVTLAYWIVVLALFYEWLGFSLERFPYTRPWGERLTQYLMDLAAGIAGAVIRTIPDLIIALVIFLIAKFIIDLLKTVFERVEQGKLQFAWLDQDTVNPTRRLISAAIWLFALVMAYPYLPGSGTEAFKGLSVLVGLMISLGASSLVGQAASGLILMYTRTIRAGEFVQIAENEGTVVELGLFTTRIRTGLGEELTLPNSLILSNVSRNYSRTVKGPGYILDTTVTIGYDTPWRQVHAMLIEAARKTPGVLPDPPPRVFQTALSDYYPEYRLVCQAIPSEPCPRAEVMNALHANIQDTFNAYGVQIMSPHYRGDPTDLKIVPRDQWYLTPAKKQE